jgi:hypothetical protein
MFYRTPIHALDNILDLLFSGPTYVQDCTVPTLGGKPIIERGYALLFESLDISLEMRHPHLDE